MGFKLLPEETNIRFTEMRMGAFAFSAIAVVASIALFFMNGLNFGIDFKGGGTIEVGPAEGKNFDSTHQELVRSEISDLGVGSVIVKEISAPGREQTNLVVLFEIQPADRVFSNYCEAARPADLKGEPADINQQVATACVKAKLVEVLGADITEERTDVVSATVSGELINAGVTAVSLAVIFMLLYIRIRFRDFKFSIGAVMALVHDVVLTIGMFALTQIEFNLPIIAAILTIVGYSMNDTVVVYDRVRENLRKFKKMELSELLDVSINQTLSRTIMTSVTTLLALGSLLVFGGEVLRGFTAAMIWGVIVGTYSSVFIASPMLQVLSVKRDYSE